MAYGVEKPASSASCHPFLRSTGLSNPLRYAFARSLVSERAKQGPIRSPMLSNRLVHNSSGDENDEGASTFIGSLLPFLFFLLSYHTYHCSTSRGPDRISERYRSSRHRLYAPLSLTVPRAVPVHVCASETDSPCSSGRLCWLISCLLGPGEYFTVIAGHEDAPQEGRWHCLVAGCVNDRFDQSAADHVRDTLAPSAGGGGPGTLWAGHLAAWWALGQY